jgi:asparagine synthetase B (glutamine-hydrolysing)
MEAGELIQDAATGLVFAIDGRIDGVEELRSACQAAGSVIETTTTAELVLRAYQIWGEDCPRHILGEYAWIIWDAARQRLFCARDSAGVGALFYAILPNGSLRFATRAAAILADPTFSRTPDEGGLVDFLIGRGALLPDRSPWLAMRRLVPGQALTFDRSGLRVSRYWSVFDPGITVFSSPDEALRACAAALQAAIRDRVAGIERAGISLSAGWDSAALFVVWQWMRQSDRRLAEPRFYTYYFDSPENDERAEVRRLLAAWPAAGEFTHLESASGLAGLQSRCAQTGMPEAASGWRWLCGCAAAARAAGISRVLVGDAGNEIFQSSILRPVDLARSGRLPAARRQIQIWGRETETPVRAFLWSFVIRKAFSARLGGVGAAVRSVQRVWRAGLHPWPFLSHRAQELALDMTAEHQQRNRPRLNRRSFSDWDKRTSLDRWCSELFPIPPLESVRLTAPFLDRRVITRALQALSLETGAGSTRGLLASTVQLATGRPLQGRYAHYTSWLESMLRSAFDERPELFRDPMLVEMGLADPLRLREYIERFQAHKGGSLTALWRLVSAEVWARHFFGRGGNN